MVTLFDKTVGELVVERPARARVFESFGIDFCCGGRKKLGAVCGEKGIDPQTLSRVLALFDGKGDAITDDRDWSRASLTELADHVERTHHAYLKRELGQLNNWVLKVANRHGNGDPRLVRLARVFEQFVAELTSHMRKEEQVLFPLCRAMAASRGRRVESQCGSVQDPIRLMFAEHDNAGNALEEMSALTDGFVPPAHACNTYRAMLDGLATLRKDMHLHVHKENNILFPKAIELEKGLIN